MKILHLNDEPWDSGLTAYALQICGHLQDARHTVCLGVRPGKKPERLAQERGLPTQPVASFWDVKRLLQQEPWDVINAHTGRTHTWALLAQSVMPARKRMPVIRTRGDARQLKIHPLSRLLYQKTAAVITASDHIRQQYEQSLRLKEEVLKTIYPSVEIDPHLQPAPSFRVGILGRLDPVKGHTTFLEAAALVHKDMPQAEFRVAGKEAGVPLSLLQNHADQLGLGESVRFLGYQASARDFMRECSVGVLASIGSEEVSRACLEWMSVGRPVVGTLVGCLPELIEPRETGLLVSPGDSRGLADALLSILKDNQRATQWGRAGWNAASNRFAPPIQLQKTLTVYQQVLRTVVGPRSP